MTEQQREIIHDLRERIAIIKNFALFIEKNVQNQDRVLDDISTIRDAAVEIEGLLSRLTAAVD